MPTAAPTTAAIALGGTDADPGAGVALTCTPATGTTPRGRVSGSGRFACWVDRLERGETELALVRLIVASTGCHDRA